MSYTEVTADLFELDLPAIGHGCNCAGSMRGGIARQFRDLFPKMHRKYVRMCASDELVLGGMFVWVTPDLIVYNLATQRESGPDADLAAISTSVTAALQDAHERGLDRLGLPRIGAGIGGLDWDDVSAVLRAAAEASPVDLVDLVVAMRPSP